MAESQATLNPDEVTQLADRLIAHAESITNAARQDVMNDLRLASRSLCSIAEESQRMRGNIRKIAMAMDDKKSSAALLTVIGE